MNQKHADASRGLNGNILRVQPTNSLCPTSGSRGLHSHLLLILRRLSFCSGHVGRRLSFCSGHVRRFKPTPRGAVPAISEHHAGCVLCVVPDSIDRHLSDQRHPGTCHRWSDAAAAAAGDATASGGDGRRGREASDSTGGGTSNRDGHSCQAAVESSADPRREVLTLAGLSSLGS